MTIHHISQVKLTWLALVTGILTISCSMQKPTQITQGIEGVVTRISGNQMPMKGRPQSKGKGLAAEVLVYAATTMQQAQGQIPLFTRVNTKLVAQTKSDSTGHYKIALPAGKYSVFIKNDGQYFAAETDGEGILNPTEVKAGLVATRNITFNVGAAY